MVFKHNGKGFKDTLEKRYFVIHFTCRKCEIHYRLRDLQHDFMGRFYCPDCEGREFNIKKNSIAYNTIKKKPEPNIVIVETRRKYS